MHRCTRPGAPASSRIELRDLVEDTLGELAEQAGWQGRHLAGLVNADLPPHLAGDAPSVRSVLVDLLRTALGLSDGGESVVNVRVQYQTPEVALVRFEVHATGAAIPRDARARLDVATSKARVELMGGELGVEAGLRCGTVLWFTIPLSTSSEAVAPLETGAGTPCVC